MPPNRSMMLDLLHYHRQMSTVSQVRRFALQPLQEQRGLCPVRIPWSLLFLKAYGLVAGEFPHVRQTLMAWPWWHLYEHPHAVANLAVTRRFDGEDWLFFAPFNHPEQTPLVELHELLQAYQEAPVEVVFRGQLRLAHFPLPIRRIFWWLRFNVSARKRIKRLGTFGLTTLAGQGVKIVDPRAPLTSVLTYGPLDEQGRCEVTIAYDHRVMDGYEVAQILQRLEQVLLTTISKELQQLSASRRASEAANAATKMWALTRRSARSHMGRIPSGSLSERKPRSTSFNS